MSSNASLPHIAEQLVNNVKELPLWVKQVIYLELRNELVQHFTPATLENLTPEDTVALYLPVILPDGERAVSEVQDTELVQFLTDASRGCTVLDICLQRSWSLEQCCGQMIKAMENKFVRSPNSIKALGTVEYLANRIRLGEYLVKMGRISVEQLDQALRTQQYIEESMHEHTGLANILINLGYITRQDTEGILFLKEESRAPIEDISIFERFVQT